LAVVAILAAPQAWSCMPGCSGYHLTFTGPGGADGSGLAVADRSVDVNWQDAVDGSSATFDILESPEPVPAFPMHSFPAQLPGQVLALGLSAATQSSWTWDTSQVAAGRYFLYAVFHNPPFNTLVMPFAVVAVAHGATVPAVPAAVFVRSPRGSGVVAGSVNVAFDAAPGDASGPVSVDLYAGAPPDAANPVLVAQGVPSGVARSVSWDARAATSGEYVFKAVLRDSSGNVLASALSPGTVEVGAAAPGGCGTGEGAVAPIVLALLMGFRRRRAL
jgi:hypothetical protein